jgi:hypothetical protein
VVLHIPSIYVPELADGSILIFTRYSALKKKHLTAAAYLSYNIMTFSGSDFFGAYSDKNTVYRG